MIKKAGLSFILVILWVFSVKGQYNFFVGPDSYKLKSTIKGLGSLSFPSVMFNFAGVIESPKKFNTYYSMAVGFNWKQWRFKEDIALLKDDNGVVIVQPTPTGEFYSNKIVGFTKTKLSMGVIRLRPELGLTLSNKKFSFGTGPLVELMLGSRHKRKFYTVEDKKDIYMKQGYTSYNINWLQLGWGASIGTFRFGAFSYVMLTPMFKKDKGPHVYAAEIGVYWRIKLLKSKDNIQTTHLRN